MHQPMLSTRSVPFKGDRSAPWGPSWNHGKNECTIQRVHDIFVMQETACSCALMEMSISKYMNSQPAIDSANLKDMITYVSASDIRNN
mmetsp:Transcript_42273/g.75697  ORF Transcript_42273/g.75697 Transcript_42273/m.75697 type:complete len:88 (-) Transcript_42273:1073-1336(-)